jgi:hypothetical protein
MGILDFPVSRQQYNFPSITTNMLTCNPRSDTLSLIFFSVKDFFITPPPNQNRLLVQPGIPKSEPAGIDVISSGDEASCVDCRSDEAALQLGSAASRFAELDADALEAIVTARLNDAAPRVADLMPKCLNRVRGFCGENGASVEEWMAVVDFVRESLEK